MLTVFNNGVGYPIANDDYYIRELASGYDEIVFNISIRDSVYQYINEEAVIKDRDQNVYLVKQIDAGEKSAKVVAQINLDDWKQTLYKEYSNNSATVYATVYGVLPSGWNVVDYSGITKRRTIPTSETPNYNVTALEILEQCISVYEVRFRFNTKDKVITIINPASYVPEGAFASRDLNLKTLNYKGKSESLVTKLYASGADGLTFASINDGKDYVENYEYSSKTICAYWSDQRYTDKQSLLDDATAKLAEMAKPSRSYSCDILDLASTNPDMYGFEDFSLFSVITLVDDAKEVRTNYQVVERWTYPYYPEKNKIILSTSTPNIQSAIAQIVSAITDSTSNFQSQVSAAIDNATKLITGNSGGYLVLHDSNNDGVPDELLIMNTPNIATATKVWRWNQQGLGYSDHGYNPPAPYGYELGMTMDGSIVATMITSGVLNADIIRAGVIEDVLGKNHWNLETGELSLSALQHEYLGNVFEDITLWHNDDGNTPFSYETIDGVKYFVIDGTNVATWGDFNSGVYTPIMLSGDNAISVHFVYYIDTPVTTTAAEKLPVIRYKRVGSSGYYHNTISFPAQSIPANTEFTWDVTMHPTNTDASEQAYFGFLPILGTKMYFKEISVSASIDSYASAGIEFNAEGLTSTVRKNDVISSINQSAEAVTINASKIDLTGNLNLHGTFTTDESEDPNLQGYYSKYDASSLQFFDDLGQLKMEVKPGYINGVPQFGIFFYKYNGQSIQARVFTEDLAGLYNVSVSGYFDMPYDGTNYMHVGCPAEFWQEVQFFDYVLNSSGGQVFISDQRKKRNIEDLVLNKARSFIMALKPRKFKFTKDISKSNRDHHGFIAQEVKEVMPEDWGLYVEDKDKDFIGLRYDEIIADLVAVVQDQQKRIEELERRLDDITNI